MTEKIATDKSGALGPDENVLHESESDRHDTGSGNLEGTGAESKSKKSRPTIGSVTALIEYAYLRKGRIALKPSELKQISSSAAPTQEDIKRLHELGKQDRLFTVPRQLLLLARDLIEIPRVRSELREFVRHLLREHPLVIVNDLDPVVQNLEDVPNLSETFSRIAATDLTALRDVAPQNGIKPAEFEVLVRNTVACLAVWVVDMRGVSISKLTDALFDGFWGRRSQKIRSEADVLRVITDVEEPVAAGLICDEFRRRSEEQARSAERSRQIAATATADMQRTVTELEATKERISELEARIDSLTHSSQEEQNKARITASHLRDDFETLRTRVLRRLNDDVRLLGDGLVALSRVPPKVDVMVDHAERVADSLRSEIKKLEEGI